MARTLRSDKGLFLAVLFLVCVSAVMVSSASAAAALQNNWHVIRYLFKQSTWVIAGFLLMARDDEDQLPRLPAAVRGVGRARHHRRQPADRARRGARDQRQQAVVRHRRHRRAAVGVRQARARPVPRRPDGAAHGQGQRHDRRGGPGRHGPRLPGRPDAAAAGPRHVGVPGDAGGGDDLRRRPALPLPARRRRLRAAGPGGADPAVAAARGADRADHDVDQPVVGRGRRRLPDHPVVHRHRLGRRHRPRLHAGPAEDRLPARVEHRLHLRGHRRGVRPDRHHAGAARLRRHRLARLPRGDDDARHLRLVPRPRPDHAARGAGARQHQRGDRRAAQQGPAAAVRQRRRVVDVRLDAGGRDAAEPVAAHGAAPGRRHEGGGGYER